MISAGMSTIVLICSIYIHISLKGQPIAEVTRLGADRLTDQEKEERRIKQDRKFSPENYENSAISYIWNTVANTYKYNCRIYIIINYQKIREWDILSIFTMILIFYYT